MAGVAVLQSGPLVKASSPIIRRIELVRDTKLVGGHASVRITRVAIERQLSGRGYLTITEFRPLAAAEGEVS